MATQTNTPSGWVAGLISAGFMMMTMGRNAGNQWIGCNFQKWILRSISKSHLLATMYK